MQNRTVNDIFSQTGKLAIVTGLIGELGHKPTLALAAAEALQMKLFSPPGRLVLTIDSGDLGDGFYMQRSLSIGNCSIRARARVGL